MTTPRALRLDPSDNVIIAIDDVPAGAAPADGVSARERVPKGHKMAVVPVGEGAPIRKFGQIIGFASRPIAAGEWVHEHNCAVHEFARDYHFGEDTRRREHRAGRGAADLPGLSARRTARSGRATIWRSSLR